MTHKQNKRKYELLSYDLKAKMEVMYLPKQMQLKISKLYLILYERDS